MKMKQLVLIAAIITIITATAFAALTTITLSSPADNEHMRGAYVLTASLGPGESADTASFWNSTDGITWTLIGTNATTGSSFALSWNTVGYDMTGVVIKVNASNDTTTVPDQNSGITVDNTNPVISNVSNSTPNEYNITITWTTNENANSTVDYGTTTALGTAAGNNANSTSHSVALTPLLENTLYYYNATSCDRAGNCNTTGPNSFTTASKAPVITSVTASTVYSNYAIITWTTHELSNSTVNYGTTTALGTAADNATSATAHIVSVTPLTNGTFYYYNVTSCDAAGNCNTTGPLSFTTMVDTTLPDIPITYINGTTTIATNVGSMINITASISDNTNISTAWAKFNYNDGTTVNKTMSILSGTNPFWYTLLHNVSKSGVQNITVYAKDIYNNVNNGTTLTMTGYGYFTLNANITSPFKNFSYGTTYAYKITVINDNNMTENYTLTTNMTNISGWSVAQSSGTITNVASLGSADITITVTVPSNALNNTVVTTYVNSSSNHSSSKAITFQLPLITITTPPIQYVSNNSNLTSMTYHYYNTTNVSWWKIINVTGITPIMSEVDGNITGTATVMCGLFQNNTYKYAGTINITTGTCWLNATAMTAGLYNLTINATNARGHRGNINISMVIPSYIAINATAPSSKKSTQFLLEGTLKYNGVTPAPFVTVNATYGTNFKCNGTTNYNGFFSIPCIAPSTTGTYQVDVTTLAGVWNTTSNASITTLTVTTETQQPPSSNNTGQGQYITLSTSASGVTLDGNKTFKITVLNNRTSTQTYVILISQGEVKRFNYEFNGTLTVASKQTGETTVKLSPINMSKPGAYYLTISIPQEGVSKTVTVVIPDPYYASDSLTSTRYIEEKLDNSSATVIIRLKNTKNATIVAEVTETIPKDFANNTSYVTFDPQPTEIINADPVVKWVVALKANETKDVKYTVSKMASNVTFAEPDVKMNEVITGDGTPTGGSESNKTLLIIGIVIATAAAAILILYKDEIFKRGGVKFIKPANIMKKKDEPFESPYPGRKLDSFGEGANVDKLGTMPAKKTDEPMTPEKKKESKSIDFSKLG
ncbi:hypothetical protein H0N95_02350 [Candidatus Micrarchaeota archaeon]|nr:hypothetical protein [Candidatus Micrarchaeota archaeon]